MFLSREVLWPGSKKGDLLSEYIYNWLISVAAAVHQRDQEGQGSSLSFSGGEGLRCWLLRCGVRQWARLWHTQGRHGLRPPLPGNIHITVETIIVPSSSSRGNMFLRTGVMWSEIWRRTRRSWRKWMRSQEKIKIRRSWAMLMRQNPVAINLLPRPTLI